jgi:catechol 2,3-dioxygenase-like lactoylglutathione lyase family enzyme
MTPKPFELRKIGHVVLNVTDLAASVRFYTEVLGLLVSDRYPDSMVAGGMVFLRCNTDHHGVALVGGGQPGARSPLNHFAFEVGSLDEVFRARAWLRAQGVPIVFEGRRRAGCQVAVESPTRTATTWRSTGTWIRSARRAMCAPWASGVGRGRWRTRSRIRCRASAFLPSRRDRARCAGGRLRARPCSDRVASRAGSAPAARHQPVTARRGGYACA